MYRTEEERTRVDRGVCVCDPWICSVLVRERERKRERERERGRREVGRSPPSFVVQGKGEKGAREREEED